jgi:hypothetical protein
MNPKVTEAVAAVSRGSLSTREGDLPILRSGGISRRKAQKPTFDGWISGAIYWFDDEPNT